MEIKGYLKELQRLEHIRQNREVEELRDEMHSKASANKHKQMKEEEAALMRQIQGLKHNLMKEKEKKKRIQELDREISRAGPMLIEGPPITSHKTRAGITRTKRRHRAAAAPRAARKDRTNQRRRRKKPKSLMKFFGV